MNAPRDPEPTPEQLADLSALADGSLPPERHSAVEQRIAASPELNRLYTRERDAVGVLRASAERERAPVSLRERIEADRQRAGAGAIAGGRGRTVRGRPRRLAFGGGFAGLAAAIAVVLVLVLPGGAATPSLAAAAALGTRPVTAPAPQLHGDGPGTLDRNVGEVYFPTFASLGYRASGQRTDSLNGHRAVTVFYRGHGGTVAYTILTSPPLKVAGRHLTGGYVLGLKLNGRNVASWRRDGDACVMSSTELGTAALRGLAMAELAGRR